VKQSRKVDRWTSPFYLAISSRCTLYEVSLINYAGENGCAFLRELVYRLAGPLRRTIAIRRDSYPLDFIHVMSARSKGTEATNPLQPHYGF